MSKLSVTTGSALVMLILGVLFCVISFSTDYWAETDITVNHTLRSNETLVSITGGKGHHGLFRVYNCENLTKYECGYNWLRDLSDVEIDYLNACLSAICLAFVSNLFGLITFGCYVADLGSQSLSGFIKKVTIILIMIAVAFNMIAVIVFAVKDEKAFRGEPGMSEPGVSIVHTFGWSWGMAIVAVVVEFLGICLILFTEEKPEYQEQI